MEQPRADNRAVPSTAKAGLPLLAMTLVQSVLMEEAIKQSPLNFYQPSSDFFSKARIWGKSIQNESNVFISQSVKNM